MFPFPFRSRSLIFGGREPAAARSRSRPVPFPYFLPAGGDGRDRHHTRCHLFLKSVFYSNRCPTCTVLSAVRSLTSQRIPRCRPPSRFELEWSSESEFSFTEDERRGRTQRTSAEDERRGLARKSKLYLVSGTHVLRVCYKEVCTWCMMGAQILAHIQRVEERFRSTGDKLHSAPTQKEGGEGHWGGLGP